MSWPPAPGTLPASLVGFSQFEASNVRRFKPSRFLMLEAAIVRVRANSFPAEFINQRVHVLIVPVDKNAAIFLLVWRFSSEFSLSVYSLHMENSSIRLCLSATRLLLLGSFLPFHCGEFECIRICAQSSWKIARIRRPGALFLHLRYF